VPRGVYERKPRKPKTAKEVVKPTKVKKTKVAKTSKTDKVRKVKEPKVKVAKTDKVKIIKEPKIKSVKETKTEDKVSEIPAFPVQVTRSWLQPLPYPDGIELVELKDITPELRASVSVFHEDGVVQFARMMFRKYGITKFTKATYKGGKYYFFYEEPKLARRK
jgi:hypothetical protein